MAQNDNNFYQAGGYPLAYYGPVTQPTLENQPFATKDMLDKKQDTLVSGENIKTINEETLLGSGNMEIESGGEAIATTYIELKELRDNSQLMPSAWYRITDYHTTVSPLLSNVRSIDNQFDIIVRADDVNILNETAHATHHDGDTYFTNCKLEAWQIQYRLDNDKWSKQSGTFAEDDNDGYTLKQIGTVEIESTNYILWDASEFTEDYDIVQAVSTDAQVGTELKGYDPETGEMIDDWSSTIASVDTVEEDGQGTILMLKDEYGNQCPYDFKNIQFKRWAVTDSQQERQGLNGNYMGVLDNVSQGLTIDDDSDFIWAYTFSSDASGNEQTDYSLDGTHNVYGNVMETSPDVDGVLNNIVLYGEYNYANRFGFNCYYNTFGNDCQSNTFGNGCYQNTFGNYFQYNTFGNDCYYNTFGNNFQNNTFGNYCYQNTFGNNCQSNTFGNSCSRNTFGNSCGSNTFGNGCYGNTFGNN